MSVVDLLTGVGIPGLQIGASLLQATYTNLENVKLYRRQCTDISNRCVSLMLALRDSSAGLEGQTPSELADEVTAIVQRIHRKVNAWAQLSQLRSFLQQKEIKEGIDRLHRDIDTAVQNFNIQLNLQLARGQSETRAIQERDKAEIRELLERIVNSNDDMKALTEHPDMIEDVMVSLQNELHDSELEPNQQHNFRQGLWEIHERTSKLPPMEDLTGQVTIQSIVVRGTYNDIYKGKWLDKESVSVRLPRIVERGNTDVQRRFEREITIWRSLDHQNVVPLYGFLRIDDDVYSVSPWMDNGTVNAFIRNNPKVDRLRILNEISEGMEYLHRKNIIHGDLRGDNVLISRDGTARLSDFGMSKVLGDCGKGATSSPTINPRWGACELLQTGGTISTFSDVWSFAIVTLEILTGEQPFSYIQVDAVVQHEVYRGRVPRRPGPDVTDRGLSDDLWKLMQRCWRKKPQSRPSMTEIKEKLLFIRGLTSPAASPKRGSKITFRSSSSADSATSKTQTFHLPKCTSPPAIQTVSESGRIDSIHEYDPNHIPSPSSSSSFQSKSMSLPIPRSHERPLSSAAPQPHPDHTIPRLDIPTSLDYSPEFKDTFTYSPASDQESSPASQFSRKSSLLHLEKATLSPQAEPGEIIYHSNSLSVVSGTLEGLVDRLIRTHSLQKDLEYRDVLLATLVDFTPAEDFFAMLARRFYDAEVDQQLHARNRVDTQYNVYAVTLYWLSNSNFYVDTPLLLRMKDFCISSLSVKRSSTMNDKAKEVLRAIDARSATVVLPETSPMYDIPKSSEMQPKHLAIALTLIQGDKYRAIIPADYILHLKCEMENRVEAAKKVNKAIQLWVQKSIIYPPRLDDRAAALVFFVNTGQECLKIRNFASVAAIATALRSEAIQDHLKMTLGQLTPRQRQAMDGLINIMNPMHKYRSYHTALGQPSQLDDRERCVPWIDAHIEDLDSVLQNNGPTIEHQGRTLINFERHVRFIDKVKEVLYYKSPDLEEYRPLGYLRYLEDRLRSIRLDDPKFEQLLLERAKARELDEDRMHRNRTLELRRVGFSTAS